MNPTVMAYQEQAVAAIIAAEHTRGPDAQRRLYARAYAFVAVAVTEQRHALPAAETSDRALVDRWLAETLPQLALLGARAGALAHGQA